MGKFWRIICYIAVAVVSFAGVYALRSGDNGPDAESFRNSKEQPKFCEEAEPLDFSKSAELSAHRRAHLLEDLGELAPDDIAGEFNRLISWYEHPSEAEQDRFRQATVRVGEFIERSCDGINLGGIRT
ncbi:hypothetical protein ACFVYF_26150 [Streptomyces sp. NPDC058274]|uniref:hypothetical protein n=1 Tax=Streptomyces sp. NPDC058274 TaxID=3346416 RepID=UPI0036EBD0C0